MAKYASGASGTESRTRDIQAFRVRRDRHGYVALLGLRVADALQIRERVEQGLSYTAFEHLQRNLALSARELAGLVQIRPRTLARRKEEGRLRPDESDRVLRASRVFGKALSLFEGDADAARRWLSSEQLAFGGATPLEVARTEIGAREVEDLIGRLEHGVFS